MFEFEDHHSLEDKILKAGEGAAPLHGGHRLRVLAAAKQAQSRRAQRRALVTCGTLFLMFTLLFLTRDSGTVKQMAAKSDAGWSKTIYTKGSQVLGISSPASQQAPALTDWNSVQSTLKQSGEWGLVDAVVRFRNERAGTIEQIFNRGD